MAITTTITGYRIRGNKRVTYGTWDTDGTGGAIDTGLIMCEHIYLQTTGSAVSADQNSVNQVSTTTLPAPGNSITIVTTDTTTGNWEAWGY